MPLMGIYDDRFFSNDVEMVKKKRDGGLISFSDSRSQHVKKSHGGTDLEN